MASEKLVPNISREDFTKNLAESGLFNAADLLPDTGVFVATDGAGVAHELVAAGKLTAFQADALLIGRHSDLKMGNYEILERLGAGAMGTVLKARHRRMKRIVALKVLSANVASSEAFANRFQREVETIARLTHPNIVMAFDADEGEAGPFLVMEFVNGRDLATEVTIGGPMSLSGAVDRIHQAARGLAYAHDQGIIHRDIKPGNLLRDIEGVVKVADLGLARLSVTHAAEAGNTSLTQAGGVVGTLDYMAPEQAIDSTTVDHRADIYSLGCTLYFLLTGRPPYRGGSMMSLLLKHRDAPIPKLSEARPNIPSELEAIFQRMVAKSPSDRFQTMAEVVKELEGLALSGRLEERHRQGGPMSLNEPTKSTTQTVVFEGGSAATSMDKSQVDQSTGVTGMYEPSPDAMRIAGKTIILVEPSRTQAGIIRRYLQQLGIDTVHTTLSGSDSLGLAKREHADAIISSMHLSDMTGVQLARALLADSECSGIGFILATSESDIKDTEAIPNSPRVAVMLKPFDLQRLNQSIAAVLAG
jgi:serine/threonine protein kinase